MSKFYIHLQVYTGRPCGCLKRKCVLWPAGMNFGFPIPRGLWSSHDHLLGMSGRGLVFLVLRFCKNLVLCNAQTKFYLLLMPGVTVNKQSRFWFCRKSVLATSTGNLYNSFWFFINLGTLNLLIFCYSATWRNMSFSVFKIHLNLFIYWTLIVGRYL